MGEVGVWRTLSDEEHIANLVMAGFTSEEAKIAHQERLQGIANQKPKKIVAQTKDGEKIDVFSLCQLLERSIKATTKDGKTYTGDVVGFTDPFGSYSGFEEIDIYYSPAIEGRINGIVLQEDEIEKIIVLD